MYDSLCNISLSDFRPEYQQSCLYNIFVSFLHLYRHEQSFPLTIFYVKNKLTMKIFLLKANSTKRSQNDR